MTTSNLARGVGLLALASISGTPALAAPRLQEIDFLPAVQSITQGARVLLVNLTSTPGRVNLPPDPCRVVVHFVDANGDALGAGQVFSIPRGHSIVAVAPVFVATGLPTSVRAHVAVAPGASESPPDPCAGLRGSYEVFDTRTLETSFVSPGAIRGFNPQPDPPGVVGR